MSETTESSETADQSQVVVNQQSPWEFACSWYNEDQIFIALNQRPEMGRFREPIPPDVTSREFAKWITHQYRLAMNKGIEIGQRGSLNDRSF